MSRSVLCDSDSSDTISRQVEANAKLARADLDLGFDVPVFRTAQSDPSIGLSPKRMAEEERVIRTEESPPPDKIRLTSDDQGNPCLVCSCWAGGSIVIAMCNRATAKPAP